MSPIRRISGTFVALTMCLFIIGLWQVAEGSWIYAKAWLAQLLLQRAWSHTLEGEGIVKPWLWADTWPVARLTVPSQDIDQIVLNGAYGRTLAFGPGHVESGRSVGQKGTIILTGHRDTHFRFLHRLEHGEVISLQDQRGQWIRFTVQDHQIVDSRTASIHTDGAKTQLVLVTCYPFDAIVPGGPMRYVVVAEKE